MPSPLRSLRDGTRRLWNLLTARWTRRSAASRDEAFRRREDQRLRGLRLKPDFDPLEDWFLPNDPMLLQAPFLGTGLALLGVTLRGDAASRPAWDAALAAQPLTAADASVTRAGDPLDLAPTRPAPTPPVTPTGDKDATASNAPMSRAVGGATRRESDWGLEGSTDDWLVAAGLALDAARRQRLASSEGGAAPHSSSPGGALGASTGAASQASELVTPPSPGAAPTSALDPDLSSVLAAATPPAPQPAPRLPTPAYPTSGATPSPAGADAPTPGALPAPASPGTPNAPTVPADRPRPMTLQPGFGQQPLIFEANRGQADPAAPFLGRARDHALLLSPTQAVLTLPPRPGDGAGERVSDTLRLEFVGANPDAVLRGADELPSRSNYFRGGETPLQVTDVPNYGRVMAEGVYPGIDLVYRSTALGQLEYDLVLGAGADPSAVQVAFHGAASMQVDDRGRLLLGMPGGQVVHESPILFQEDAGGHRQEVSGRFTLLGDNLIGFQADAYDASRPLIIDPVLSYSQYVGGSDYDTANAVATDLAGNVYITGGTGSSNLSVLNPQQGSLGGYFDAFARKYSPSGTLLYSTYLGGGSSTEFSIGNEIAVDAAGNAYITGETEESSFPVTSGAYDTSFSGTGQAAFLTKLSAAGNALVYSTFLGDDFTAGHGVAVDAQGQAVVVGFTDDNSFPTTVGAADTTFNSSGERDAFATKFRADGSGLIYSTFVGGDGIDSGFDVALDTAGNAYIVGATSAATGGSLTPFPAVNAYQSSVAGGTDVFLTKINPQGTAYVYSTLLGGSNNDYATGVAVDTLGQAFLTGQTMSSNWPVAGSLDTTLGQLRRLRHQVRGVGVESGLLRLPRRQHQRLRL